MIVLFRLIFQIFNFIISCFYVQQFWFIIQSRICTNLLNRKCYSNSASSEAITTSSFIIRCLCNSSKAKFFIMFISCSVNLAGFKISGSVNESNKINDLPCLTTSNIVAKY